MVRLLGLVNNNRTGSSCCTTYTCFRDRLNKSVIPLFGGHFEDLLRHSINNIFTSSINTKITSWRQILRHDVQGLRYKIPQDVKKHVMTPKTRHDAKQVVMTSNTHHVKECFMTSKNTSWRQNVCKTRHDVIKSHNYVKHTSWRQKHVMTPENSSWRQRVRYNVNNTSWRLKHRYNVKNMLWD